ncbi:MAG: hypothetical protein V4695_00620 [Pseudomonadota bacterium]
MASFKSSFVIVSKERDASPTQAIDDIETCEALEEFSGDAVMIEEITIIVRADVVQPDSKDDDQKALATLDPLSQLLWLQTLRHLH